jgi:AhpD family alkylhydroperoxidase
MPHIPVLPPEQASKEFYRRMSFPAPPNFITTQGHSHTAARGTWELVRNVLLNGEIPRWKKEMIFVAISRDRQCHYCEAAHVACCRMLGGRSRHDRTAGARRNDDPRSGAARHGALSLKCSRDPQSLETADYELLTRHGLNHSEIVELVAMSGLAVYANIMADATAMEPDKIFTSL